MRLRVACDDAGAAEIFRSVQGEGRNAGRVRTFIRLSGCNLHCVWCDTAYTWNWIGSSFTHVGDAPGRPFKFDPAQEMRKLSIDEAAALIGELPSEGVVITGGEPMLQAEAVTALIAALRAEAPVPLIEMETNGSIAPSDDLAESVDLFMVSPKLAHSGNDDALALKPRALAAYAGHPRAFFKFVARGPEDLGEVAALAANYDIAPARIYVMPEGVDSDIVTARAGALIGAVIAHGYNFSDRLHVHLFGARRGV